MSRPLSLRPALALVAAWTAITVGLQYALGDTGRGIDELATGGPLAGVAVAGALILLATGLLGWRRETGLVAPSGLSARLVGLPLLIVGAMVALAVVHGIPPMPAAGWAALNAAMVGVSEELAFRGVLLAALVGALGVRRGVLAAAVAFGLVHSLNGFITGEFGSALAQSVLATGMGIWASALRLRTGSLALPIVLHALWDFALLVAATGESSGVTTGLLGLTFAGVVILAIYGWIALRPLRAAA